MMHAEKVSLRKKKKSLDETSESKVPFSKNYIGSDYSIKLPSTTEPQQQESVRTSIQITGSIFEDNLSDSDSAASDSVVLLQSSQIEFDNTNFDFLDAFTNVPDLDDISDDSLKLYSELILIKEEEINEVDEGEFVDPLTGEMLGKEVEDVKAITDYGIEADMAEEVEEESEESVMQLSVSEDSELLLLLEPKDTEVADTAVGVADALEKFLAQEVIVTRAPTLTIVDETIEKSQKLHNMLVVETENFMQKLIDEVVQKAEYTDPTEMLRKNLDKSALMDEIVDKLENLEVERKIRLFLNRKVVDFHKRRSMYRAITDEPRDVVMKEMKKLENATRCLDYALNLQNVVIEKTEEMKTNIYAELNELQQDSDEKEKELEILVYGTLVKKGNERLPMIIHNLLGKISTYRNEISKVFFDLIQKQHTKALFEKKIDQYERDLKLREYEILHTQTIDLDKKIEERNVELNHLRKRRNSEIHAISHLKEKSSVMRIFTKVEKSALEALLQNKQETREYLVDLKMERSRLQSEIRELTYQSGLLCKPALLRDYDAIVAQVAKVRENIKILSNQRKDLINKIAKLEKKNVQIKINRGQVP